MTKKIGIVYVTYDGALNSTCGVGVLSQYFIKSFPAAARSIEKSKSVTLSLEVIAVRLDQDAHGYSAKIKDVTERIAGQSGGQLHLIENGTNGTENYGNLDNWEIVSKEAAQKIRELSKSYDQLLVYLVDTPFLGTPYFARQTKITNATYILVPHSDVFSHFPDNFPLDRLGWEAAGFMLADLYDEVFLADTSKYLGSILREHYKIREEKVIVLQTGLFLEDDRFKRASGREIELALSTYDIPLDKSLIFSVARAVPYKGFEDLIHSFAILKRTQPEAHLVFIASPHRNSSSNIPELERLIEAYDLASSCTPIYELDMELPRLICQWPLTKIVAQLSHREPFGLVPEEVRIWARFAGPTVVVSNVGGFKEQVDDRKDGFLVTPYQHREVAQVFEDILRLDKISADLIRTTGYRRCFNDFNYAKTVEQSIEYLIGKL